MKRMPQRVSAFVASQVSRREFFRHTSTMALGVVVAAVPTLDRSQRAPDLATLQRIRFDAPRVLSASEVVALGLPLYSPGNQLQSGPDCPCDCSWGCHWVQVGTCYGNCGSCQPRWDCPFAGVGSQSVCHWDQCLDCCDDVCDERCSSCYTSTCCC